ncbi:hypothetical protein TIFTF001_045348 [Ficus carica]|uniref:Uncharacterized protein n=1 Tax=Ficus carica TaxID=3494 RepID=A0AA87YQW8_FICCA|nr:hypothetical protein TIFTF001_045348 [Ficus carica]
MAWARAGVTGLGWQLESRTWREQLGPACLTAADGRHVARRSWATRLGSAASCRRGSVAGTFRLHFLGFV